MARAVDMGVVARIGLIFHMRGRNGDAARLFLGRSVDLVIGLEVAENLVIAAVSDVLPWST